MNSFCKKTAVLKEPSGVSNQVRESVVDQLAARASMRHPVQNTNQFLNDIFEEMEADEEAEREIEIALRDKPNTEVSPHDGLHARSSSSSSASSSTHQTISQQPPSSVHSQPARSLFSNSMISQPPLHSPVHDSSKEAYLDADTARRITATNGAQLDGAKNELQHFYQIQHGPTYV